MDKKIKILSLVNPGGSKYFRCVLPLDLLDKEKYEVVFVESYIERPTHALAIEWIRVNFDIHVAVTTYLNIRKLDKMFYEASISNQENGYDGLLQNVSNRLSINWIIEPKKYWLFDSPQEATEAALLHVLKELI